jgi:hypothetical protein
MALVASGLLNKQVGGELNISEITVQGTRPGARLLFHDSPRACRSPDPVPSRPYYRWIARHPRTKRRECSVKVDLATKTGKFPVCRRSTHWGSTPPQEPVTDRFRLTPGPRVLQLLPKSPPETRPIRRHAIRRHAIQRHAIQVSFSRQLPPTIYCGVSLTLLLRFCTVLTLTAISVFSINAGLNTSASLKKICRAGAGLLSFILKTYREC